MKKTNDLDLPVFCLLAEQEIPIRACIAEQATAPKDCRGCASPTRRCLKCETFKGNIADPLKGHCADCAVPEKEPLPPLLPALDNLQAILTQKGIRLMDDSGFSRGSSATKAPPNTPVSGVARIPLDLDKIFRFLDGRSPKEDKKFIHEPIPLIGRNVVGTGQAEAKQAIDELKELGFVWKDSGYAVIEIPKRAWGQTPSKGLPEEGPLASSIRATDAAASLSKGSGMPSPGHVPEKASPPPRPKLSVEEEDDALLWSAHVSLKRAIGRNDTEKAVANARQVLLNDGVTKNRDQAERLVSFLEKSIAWERVRKKARNSDGRVTKLLLPDATEADLRTLKAPKSDPKPEPDSGAADEPAANDISDEVLEAAMRTLTIAGSGKREVPSPLDWLSIDGSSGHEPVAILDALERNGRIARDPKDDGQWKKAIIVTDAPIETETGPTESPEDAARAEPPREAAEQKDAGPEDPAPGSEAEGSAATSHVPDAEGPDSAAPASPTSAPVESDPEPPAPPRHVPAPGSARKTPSLADIGIEAETGANKSGGSIADEMLFGKATLVEGRQVISPRHVIAALKRHAVAGEVANPIGVLMDAFGLTDPIKAKDRLRYARRQNALEPLDDEWNRLRLLDGPAPEPRPHPDQAPTADPEPTPTPPPTPRSETPAVPADDMVEAAWKALVAAADSEGWIKKPIPLLEQALKREHHSVNRYLNALLEGSRIEKPGKRFDRIRLLGDFAPKESAPAIPAEATAAAVPKGNGRDDPRLPARWAKIKEGFREGELRHPLAFLQTVHGIPKKAGADMLTALAAAGHLDPQDGPGWERARFPLPPQAEVERVLFEAKDRDDIIDDPIAILMKRFGLKNSRAAELIDRAKRDGAIVLVDPGDEYYRWTKPEPRRPAPEPTTPLTKPAASAPMPVPASDEAPPTKPPTAQAAPPGKADSPSATAGLRSLADPAFRRSPEALRHLAALADARGSEGAALAAALRREADIREQAEKRIDFASKATDAELGLLLG